MIHKWKFKYKYKYKYSNGCDVKTEKVYFILLEVLWCVAFWKSMKFTRMCCCYLAIQLLDVTPSWKILLESKPLNLYKICQCSYVTVNLLVQLPWPSLKMYWHRYRSVFLPRSLRDNPACRLNSVNQAEYQAHCSRARQCGLLACCKVWLAFLDAKTKFDFVKRLKRINLIYLSFKWISSTLQLNSPVWIAEKLSVNQAEYQAHWSWTRQCGLLGSQIFHEIKLHKHLITPLSYRSYTVYCSSAGNCGMLRMLRLKCTSLMDIFDELNHQLNIMHS